MGIDALRRAGIQVIEGVAVADVYAADPGYFHHRKTGLPRVTLKYATTLDGQAAAADRTSQWITGPEARADVQRLRARSGAVMTGIGTVLADDPSLNVRAADIDTRGLQPIRVVLDSQLRMPLAAGMLALPGTTLVCCIGNPDTKQFPDTSLMVRLTPSTQTDPFFAI